MPSKMYAHLSWNADLLEHLGKSDQNTSLKGKPREVEAGGTGKSLSQYLPDCCYRAQESLKDVAEEAMFAAIVMQRRWKMGAAKV